MSEDSIVAFSVVLACDEDDAFFGLKFDLVQRSTTYLSFRRNHRPFTVPHCHNNAVYAGESRVAFFDCSNCAFGVVDVGEGRILWEQAIRSPGNLKCIWTDGRDGLLQVQLLTKILTLDVETGETVGETRTRATLEAGGTDYSVLSRRKIVTVATRGGELEWKAANGIRMVKRFGSHLAVIEWQGPARVIDLSAGTIVFEAVPDSGSQFAGIHYSHEGPIILPQHFFDDSSGDHVRRYENVSAEKWNLSRIEMSGSFAILSTGREIAYGTRGLYDPVSGNKIGKF